MKTKRTPQTIPSPKPESRTTVRLEYRTPEAKRVSVAGTFNGWQPDGTPMRQDGDGVWAVELELLPGAYEYRFVVDGTCWCSDPNATDAALNPFGDYNAVLRVSGRGENQPNQHRPIKIQAEGLAMHARRP